LDDITTWTLNSQIYHYLEPDVILFTYWLHRQWRQVHHVWWTTRQWRAMLISW